MAAENIVALVSPDKDENPGLATYWLCDFGPII